MSGSWNILICPYSQKYCIGRCRIIFKSVNIVYLLENSSCLQTDPFWQRFDLLLTWTFLTSQNKRNRILKITHFETVSDWLWSTQNSDGIRNAQTSFTQMSLLDLSWRGDDINNADDDAGEASWWQEAFDCERRRWQRRRGRKGERGTCRRRRGT